MRGSRVCGRDGARGGKYGERKTNRKERNRKNEERRNGGGMREERGCNARITRTTGSIRAGCILTDSRRYIRARASTPAEPICPLPSTVAHLLE